MTKRKRFSCDFETTTDPLDCRVWAYGYMEIGNKVNYRIGNSLDEFMEWVETINADLYFHNLRFDGEFIINWLLKHGFEYSDSKEKGTFSAMISSSLQWYAIDIYYGRKGKNPIHTRIYDSLKKLPFPVKVVGKAFKLDVQKGDIDYHKFRPIGHVIDEEEYSYIKNDIEIIADALAIQFKQGLTGMTSGGDSLKGFKSFIGGDKGFEKVFPILSLEADANIRLAYRGGFTWLNDRFQEKEVGHGLVFDVNSLYPSIMYDRDLPYGLPIPYKGKYEHDEQFPLYIQHIRCEFQIKDGYIPLIQIKKSKFQENEYLKSSDGEIVDLYVTNVDWEMIQEHYEVYDVEYCEGWKFRKKSGLFNDFINKWMWVKNNNTGALKALAKLMLNSLYGKFATNPNVTGKIPYLKEDGSCGFKLMEEEQYRNPIYTPMGVFITSYARQLTISTAQKCFDRIIYCDTDSIHLVGTDIPEAIADVIDDDRLGYWAHETTFKKGKYIRQKTYCYVKSMKSEGVDKEGKEKFVPCHPDEATTFKFEVKCAGMPDRVKEKVTFENFRRGFSSHGKLTPKHVDGGVVLVDTVFTIK